LNDKPAIIRDAFARTVRLVTTARLREAVLAELIDADEMDEIAEIEGATSHRLRSEAHGSGGLPANQLVHGVPHARFINASFAYAKPRSPNRFNGPERGAWYSALAVETALAEVGYHLSRALADMGEYRGVVDYAEMFSSCAGEFFDLRPLPHHPALDPDTERGYPAGNVLANEAIRIGLNGIIYPSVRHAGGICLAILWPHAVQSVAQGDVWRMTWQGSPTPRTERI
jgi:RES domain-containing protein